MNNMLIREALKHSATHVDLLDRELLLAYALKKNREYIVAHEDEKIPYAKFLLYRWQLRKRKNNVPLAYIIGYKEFFGHNFFVNKYTLIPRPDTEILVESAIGILQNEWGAITLIDVGTGTGCIPISIFKTLGTQSDRIEYRASDISAGALAVACKNAHPLEAPVKFKIGHLLEPYNFEHYKNSTVIITANLPYLTHEQFEQEKSIQHEPYYALVAPEHGLALYKKLFEQVSKLSIRKIIILCEIDPSQTEEFKNIVQHYLPKALVEIKKDLSHADRVAIVSV